jgi:hypothetical protein
MCKVKKDSNQMKTEKYSVDDRLSLRDFFDPTKPWDLRDRLPNNSIRTMFKFLPMRFTEGPWKPVATLTLLSILSSVVYLTVDANIKYYASDNSNNDIMKEFVGDKSYPAFTMAWYYNVALFSWMAYVSRTIYNSYKHFGAWVSFTMCSWTIICIRHGLCALAPFLPSVRLWIGILRFPVLLSASITFGIWNFVLMPVIGLGFLKGEKRSAFLRFVLRWTMCQIHICNILYAYLNAVFFEPKAQGLHQGDVNAGVIYIVTYMTLYYCFLDRIGIQLYPIFSPRTYISIPSWIMTAGICLGNYVFWNKILAGND